MPIHSFSRLNDVTETDENNFSAHFETTRSAQEQAGVPNYTLLFGEKIKINLTSTASLNKSRLLKPIPDSQKERWEANTDDTEKRKQLKKKSCDPSFFQFYSIQILKLQHCERECDRTRDAPIQSPIRRVKVRRRAKSMFTRSNKRHDSSIWPCRKINCMTLFFVKTSSCLASVSGLE